MLWRTQWRRLLGCRVNDDVPVLREAGYDGEVSARQCGKLWRCQNNYQNVIEEHFPEQKKDLCVLKGSCLEQNKGKETLTIHLLTTFLNFKIKVKKNPGRIQTEESLRTQPQRFPGKEVLLCWARVFGI